MMTHFQPYEFECKCGKCGLGLKHIRPEALNKLLIARDMSSVPFFINSAIRCKEHNQAVGGLIDSAHLSGQAFDIRTNDDYERFIIVRALITAGFRRIGIYKTFVHADDDHTKPSTVMWGKL